MEILMKKLLFHVPGLDAPNPTKAEQQWWTNKDKHQRSAMPARVEATSTTTAANQDQTPPLPASPEEN